MFSTLVSRRWRPVKSKPGPGCLHSQCAVKFLSVMMIFGGEREGQTLSEVWRFHFGKFQTERCFLLSCQAAMILYLSIWIDLRVGVARG